MDSITIKPIGKVNSTRLKVEDDNWDKETVFVEIDSSEFTNEALFGLDTFSHVEVIFSWIK